MDEEDRPRRRQRADKPDPETFGRSSGQDVEEKNRRADTEIELGELDVDFA